METEKDRLTERQVWWITRGAGWVVGIAIVLVVTRVVHLY